MTQNNPKHIVVLNVILTKKTAFMNKCFMKVQSHFKLAVRHLINVLPSLKINFMEIGSTALKLNVTGTTLAASSNVKILIRSLCRYICIIANNYLPSQTVYLHRLMNIVSTDVSIQYLTNIFEPSLKNICTANTLQTNRYVFSK